MARIEDPTSRSEADRSLRRRLLPTKGEMLAPVLTKAILAVVFTAFCLIAFLRISSESLGAPKLGLALGLIAVLLLMQLFYFSRPDLPLSRWRYAALGAQAVLVYAPLLTFEAAWIGLPGFLAGTVLLVLPLALAWPAFTTVVISMGAWQANDTGRLFDTVYLAVSTTITGLVVYGLTRLSNTVVELNAARTELAKMAVAQERLRFARDLHDLLGYSLSAITLKSELTRRLVVAHPVRAQEELVELLDISRRALADVRSVASGYRELALDTEARSARSVLLAADVDARVHLQYGDLPQQVRTLLATVLREGVTNVLRHSKAEHCEITVEQHGDTVTLDIVNDGADVPLSDQSTAGQAATRSGVGGSGIGNLSARLSAVGGTLHAGPDPDGRWRLRASVDLSAAPQAS